MREIQGLGDEARLRRRWFHDEYFDLFVWEDEAQAVVRFELCYGQGASERALVWLGGERFFHDGGPDDAEAVLRRFERAGVDLPANVRREVQAGIRAFAGRAVTRRSAYRRAGWQQRGAGA
jgi:hypothetical protein